MISDVLFESALDIRKYLRDFPSVYADHKHDIERLLAKMARIRKDLDTPPQGKK